MNNSAKFISAKFVAKENLTDLFTDYSNVYLLPSLSAFGMLTNAVNIVVTWRVHVSDHIQSYILVNSMLDFLFLLTQFFVVIVRCGTLCAWGYTYLAKLYDLYVYLFLCYIILTFQALFNLLMTVERLLLFSNKLSKGCGKIKAILLMFTFLTLAVILNAPSFLFSRYIKEIGVSKWNNQTVYQIIVKDEYKSGFLMSLLIAFILVKNPLLYILTGLINLLVALKFRKFIRKKHQLIHHLRTTKTQHSNLFIF
jgi:hypothetical protein